ncbi:MAG: hypothetical protein ACI4IL_05515 [Eubacterium sp.]
MANKEKKGFSPALYGVVSGIVIAVILVVMTIFAFTTRYTAFSPDKVAQSYTDAVVQTADGYNSQKVTLIAKNQKHGNFIINAYMKPYINDGDNVKQADFVGTGTEKEQQAIDTVYNTMYEEYVNLLNQYGYDNYDAVYSNYFEKLSKTRQEIYGDEYMDTEYMFGAFESNVNTYAEYVAGADTKYAADGKTVVKKAQAGVYDDIFGKDYKLTCQTVETKELTADEVKAYVEEYSARIKPVVEDAEAKADAYGLTDTEDKTFKSDYIQAYKNLDSTDAISAVDLCTVEVKDQNENVVATQKLYIVKIGNSWYVDNTNCDTSALYFAK